MVRHFSAMPMSCALMKASCVCSARCSHSSALARYSSALLVVMGCPIITLTPQRSSTRDFAVRVLEGFSHRLRRFRVIGRKKAFNLVGTGRHCLVASSIFLKRSERRSGRGCTESYSSFSRRPIAAWTCFMRFAFSRDSRTLFLRMGSSSCALAPCSLLNTYLFCIDRLPRLTPKVGRKAGCRCSAIGELRGQVGKRSISRLVGRFRTRALPGASRTSTHL